MSGRGVRFGVVADGYHSFGGSTAAATDGARLAAQAVEAEELGYDLFALSDHLHSSTPTFDPWTALTWVAAATRRLTVVTDVLGLPYRNPVVLAKMAETLARLSGHRLVLGLGNGGYDPEFQAFGLAERTPREKVDALTEAVQVMRAAWSTSHARFDGEHYRLDGARLEPRPTAAVPIWIGGYGPRSLQQVGALADGWLPSLGRVELDDAAAMRETVRQAAVGAGRDPDGLTYAANVSFRAGHRPGILEGSDDAAVDRIDAITAAGFRVLLVAGLDDGAARTWFARDIIPRTQSRTQSRTADR